MTKEQILLERAKEYDEAALTELYDRYAPRIYAYIYRRIGDAQLAEDLTGDVFTRVLRAIQAEHFWHTSFQAWLYRIAHNLVVDHYRRQPELPELAATKSWIGDHVTTGAADGDPHSQSDVEHQVIVHAARRDGDGRTHGGWSDARVTVAAAEPTGHPRTTAYTAGADGDRRGERVTAGAAKPSGHGRITARAARW